ncbi:MAG: leucine-rich repeat domain-containing protein [Porphyromonadaceae bacterium]|nr:leucine-rich repeat domain-containing protein [Porphyromonadaceae bacterium]
MVQRVVIAILFFVLLPATRGYAQVRVFDARVEQYGQLKQVLGSEWNVVDSLVVHGPVNAADFRTMWRCAFEGRLTVLNLENAQIEGKRIPDYAFWDRRKQIFDDGRVHYLNIRRIILPNDVEKIGFCSFSRMKLEIINLPETLRALDHSSFSNCHFLRVDPLVIPEGITEIPLQCFLNCQAFKKVVLPSTIKTIGESAFYNTRIWEINFPEGLDSIGLAAFHGSGDLREAVLPNTAQKLGNFVFSMCDSLRVLRLPEGITRIPNNFASYCNMLEEIKIPESVTEIGSCAFDINGSLRRVHFPSKLKRIGKDAFGYSPIEMLVFPATLEYIGGGSFAGLDELKKIYSLSEEPPHCAEDWVNPGKGPFYGYTPEDTPVYVPIGSAEKYRRAFGWSYFTNFIETKSFPMGIEQLAKPSKGLYRVYSQGDRVVMEALGAPDSPCRYTVYTLGGQTIDRGTFLDSHTLQISEKGLYVVRIEGCTYKIEI